MLNPKLQILSYPDSFFRQQICLPRIPLHEQDAIRSAERARELARSFSSRVFKNLDRYPFLYFTSGITEAIDFLVSRQETRIREREYRYLQAFPTVSQNRGEMHFLSSPFSGSGNFNSWPEIEPTILDCSYLFASNMKCPDLLPSNIEYVLMGLSKSHNLADARLGWFFSKRKIPSFHVLQYEYGYLNSSFCPILEKVSEHAANALYLKFQKQFSELYKKHGLQECDTNLFAFTEEGQRVPYYALDSFMQSDLPAPHFGGGI